MRATVDLDGTARQALLDTGYPRSAITLEAAAATALDRATVTAGGVVVGPLAWGPLLFPPADGLDLVIGADILFQVPMLLDARDRQVIMAPSFRPPMDANAAPLTVWSTGLCRGDGSAGDGPEGPHFLLVRAALDGQVLTFIVDTGAEATFVRREVVDALSPRPTLGGIPVGTGFAGRISALATRARLLEIGPAQSGMQLILTADEIGAELDRLLRDFRHPPERLDGFLGWTFLREFLVGLDEGDAPGTHRLLRLARYATQAHWKREFIGIGVATSRAVDPEGLRIEGFYSSSPARDAGLLVGDVILSVDGRPAISAPTPWASPGTPVQLQFQRGAQPLSATATVLDLLPDPP
jgi:hypothetical protein